MDTPDLEKLSPALRSALLELGDACSDDDGPQPAEVFLQMLAELDAQGMTTDEKRTFCAQQLAALTQDGADEASLALRLRQLVELVRADPDLATSVLRSSADAKHRAVAAKAVGYLADHDLVARCLTAAITDPDATVRNNAVRALGVRVGHLVANGAELPAIDAEPLLRMLEALTWTDRNKAAALLESWSRVRPPELLASLRSRSVEALTEMARWPRGFAYTSFMLLGRAAELDEDQLQAAWKRAEANLEVEIAALVQQIRDRRNR